MAVQWPLVIFTLFVCITSGILGGVSLLALQGKGSTIRMRAIVASAITLVIGGIGSFLHLQHWERIFNGFGHITSGITQELIGVVVLAVLIVIWFVLVHGDKEIGKGLAVVTLICAIGMVVTTGHSYLMEGRPAWNIGLLLYYVGNGCLWGGIAVWALAVAGHEDDLVTEGAQLTFYGSIVQLAVEVLYVLCLLGERIADVGYYANVYSITTAPTHIDSLAAYAVAGPGAAMFWLSIASAVVGLACAIAARKNTGSNKAFLAAAIVCALVTSLAFRVLLYQVGFSLMVVY